jgi:hypothetical protein
MYLLLLHHKHHHHQLVAVAAAVAQVEAAAVVVVVAVAANNPISTLGFHNIYFFFKAINRVKQFMFDEIDKTIQLGCILIISEQKNIIK